jgi:hypothetical protein
MSENVGASNSRNPKGLHVLYRDIFTFTLPSGNHCHYEIEKNTFRDLLRIVAYLLHERISKHALNNRITSVYSSLLGDGQRVIEITQ